LEPIFIPRLRDEEFESPPGTLPRTLGPAPWPYLRLVANPVLGLYGVGFVLYGLGLLTAREGSDSFNCVNSSGAVLVFFLLPRLFQFHCLDCRATGRLGRWKEHVCPESAARRRDNRPRRWPGLTPGMQTFLWLVPASLVTIAVHLFCLKLR